MRINNIELCEDLYNPETMDLILENKFRFDRKYDMEYCGEIVDNKNLDWTIVPFGDPEWAYVFNRMDYCVDLCIHFEKTKDIKYLEKAKELIFDFINKNKVDNNPQLRTLDTGIRIIVWDKCLEYFTKYNAITQAEIDKLEKAMKWQMEYLYSNFEDFHKISNWGMMQSIGFLTGLKRIEMDEEKVRFYANMLNQHLDVEFFADGMQWEQSSVYIMEVVERLLQLNNGKYKSAKYYQVLNKAGYAMFAISDFDGKSTLIGDGDEIDFVGCVQCLAYVTNDRRLAELVRKFMIREEVYFKYGQSAIDFLLSVDKACDKFSYDMFESEYYMSKDNDFYVSLQNGNMGYGHGHYDNLHVNLSINSQKILVDSGRYTYVNDNHYRKDFKGFKSHNGPFINNPDLQYVHSWENKGFYETLPVKKVESPKVYHLETSYMPKDDVICTRRMTAVDNKFVVISDYCNSDYNINYKLYQTADLQNNKIESDYYNAVFVNVDDIKLVKGELSCKYNLLQDTSVIEIKQKRKNTAFAFWGPNDMHISAFDDFEYLHEKRLKPYEKQFRLYKISYGNKSYIYAENKYLSGNCNNTIILDNKIIMANIFVYDCDKKTFEVLKK